MRGQYSLLLWNYYSYDGSHTNSRLEGWHNRLKRIVKKPHPNIYELIDVFKGEQAATEVTCQQLETGAIHSSTVEKEVLPTGAEGSADQR